MRRQKSVSSQGLLLLLLLSWLPSFAASATPGQAEAYIVGTLQDDASGAAIERASVALISEGRLVSAMLSESDGWFELPMDFSPAEDTVVTVSIAAPGFKSQDLPVRFTGPSRLFTLLVRMQRQGNPPPPPEPSTFRLVRFIVTDGLTSMPVQGAQVSLLAGDRESMTGLTSQSGTLTLTLNAREKGPDRWRVSSDSHRPVEGVLNPSPRMPNILQVTLLPESQRVSLAAFPIADAEQAAQAPAVIVSGDNPGLVAVEASWRGGSALAALRDKSWFVLLPRDSFQEKEQLSFRQRTRIGLLSPPKRAELQALVRRHCEARVEQRQKREAREDMQAQLEQLIARQFDVLLALGSEERSLPKSSSSQVEEFSKAKVMETATKLLANADLQLHPDTQVSPLSETAWEIAESRDPSKWRYRLEETPTGMHLLYIEMNPSVDHDESYEQFLAELEQTCGSTASVKAGMSAVYERLDALTVSTTVGTKAPALPLRYFFLGYSGGFTYAHDTLRSQIGLTLSYLPTGSPHNGFFRRPRDRWALRMGLQAGLGFAVPFANLEVGPAMQGSLCALLTLSGINLFLGPAVTYELTDTESPLSLGFTVGFGLDVF